jgi:hypothetical protein
LSARVARAHPMPARTPQRHRSQVHLDSRGAPRANELAPELAPLRLSSRRQAVVLPPINTLLTSPTASLPSPLTHTDTEPATPPNKRSEAFLVAPDGGFLVSPGHQLSTARHTVPVQVQLEETPLSAGVKRTRASALEETSDSSSMDSWSSRVSINTDEYAPVWQRDAPAHSGTRIRQLKVGRNSKRKAYGYCHYVADDYCLREACTWVPPREIRNERSEEGWFRFAERILDWRDQAMRYQGTQEERDGMVWHCGDAPSELRTKHMHATKVSSETDELQPNGDRVTHASKRRRG